MKFGIRQEVSINDYSDRLSKVVGVPIELALPYKLEDFLVEIDSGLLESLIGYCKSNGIIVNSIHATQGRISDDNFINWSSKTCEFARKLGVSIVVFHPETTTKNKRLDYQYKAIKNIKRIKHDYHDLVVAIETFSKADRIITPEEIIEMKLPMVLDTSHLLPERVMKVIEEYSDGIVSVHLSEASDNSQHMPVNNFGYKVIERLKEKNYSGVITLEYMPEYHHLLISDRQALEEMYG